MILRHVLAILIALDILINALTGGAAYMTLSARIGASIQANGLASRVPWPQWLRAHFINSVFETTV